MGEDAPKYDIEPGWVKQLPLGLRGLLWFCVGLFALFFVILVVKFMGAVLFGGDAKDIQALGLTILAIVAAPFAIWRTKVAQGNLDRSRDRDYADLFTKAVEQLGATREVIEYPEPGEGYGDGSNRNDGIKVLKPNIEVRLGAIYALERISQDSERDHIAVMETLCAYVRENSPAHSIEPSEPPPLEERNPNVDIQAVITVIGRRAENRCRFEEDKQFRLDFRRSDLSFVDFSKGNFRAAIFFRCRLEGAVFDLTDLSAAHFHGALLDLVQVFDTKMHGTIFDHATISNLGQFGTFVRTEMNGASVAGANIAGFMSFGKNQKCIFGSRDTILTDRHTRERDLDLAIAHDFSLLDAEDDPEVRKDIIARVESSKFGHWCPFDSSDAALDGMRSQHLERFGLVGWPYQ